MADRFMGRAERTVNKDGRVSIPSKMREIIKKKYDSAELYLVLMPGNVVSLYPEQEFDQLTLALTDSAEAGLADIMDVERLYADAELCKLDGSGRIVVPSFMRKAAEIEQDVLVLGAKTHIEIWNPQVWFYSRRNKAGIDKYKTRSTQPVLG